MKNIIQYKEKDMKNKKGFTLTELIVVIVIIGILAAVLVPSLTGYIDKARYAAAEKEATSYVTAFGTWQIEEEITADSTELLTSFQNYLEEIGLDKDVVKDVTLTGFTYTSTNEVEISYNTSSGFSK